jgi:hypothetical protein
MEEKIISHFRDLLGDKLCIIRVAYCKDELKKFCDENNISRDFVINTLKNHLSQQN